MYFVKCYCHEDITPTAWSIITIHFEQRRKSTCTCQNIFYNLLIAQLIHLLLLTSFLLTTLQICLDFEIVILKIHIVHSCLCSVSPPLHLLPSPNPTTSYPPSSVPWGNLKMNHLMVPLVTQTSAISFL